MKMGILGAGHIAGTMAKTVLQMNGAEVLAVGARELQKAQKFAEEFQVKKAYGSYEDLVSDMEVDLIYVATPHSHHYEHVKLCLEHGKHVLCEKAFTRNAKEAKELFALAKEKKLLLTEAIWTRYMPMRQKMTEIMESGIIGEITSLYASLGYVVGNLPRMQEPSLAGGALLDLGVYPLNFALMTFGTDIKEISTAAILTEKGVDASNSFTLTYRDKKQAVIHSNMMVATERKGMVYGSEGYIEFLNINNCEGIRVYNRAHEVVAEYSRPEQINGYEYEVEACMEAIKAGALECPQMPHEESIRVMEIMDELRASWGVKYPGEE